MATEEDRQEERDRLGSDPVEAPTDEVLEDENPVESPAGDSRTTNRRTNARTSRRTVTPQPSGATSPPRSIAGVPAG
jgi:hypothetical protein